MQIQRSGHRVGLSQQGVVMTRGGKRVAGFGIGGFFEDTADTILDYTGIVKKSTGSTPNPEYRATAAITGQQVDQSAPADTVIPDVHQACENLPTWAQPIGGCSNANVKLAPGQSAPTAPESVVDALTKGGVDANGNRVKTPTEAAADAASDAFKWFGDHKTAIAIGAVVLVGGVLYAVVRR